MNDMNERVALVTGGTRGIGAAISTHLAQHGATIAAVYNRNAQAADAFAKEASNKGQKDQRRGGFGRGAGGGATSCSTATASAASSHGTQTRKPFRTG